MPIVRKSFRQCANNYIGMKVFEKKIGGHLHAHSLQFVMPDNFDRIEVWADR